MQHSVSIHEMFVFWLTTWSGMALGQSEVIREEAHQIRDAHDFKEEL